LDRVTSPRMSEFGAIQLLMPRSNSLPLMFLPLKDGTSDKIFRLVVMNFGYIYLHSVPFLVF
jgi:hypothetical protein